jgi:thiol-disulfide isomerase/thioredoxin
VVVNFWASWCVPCRKELPTFAAVAQRLGSQVAFLGVNHQDQRRGALDLQEQMSVPYPSGYDPAGGVHAAYGLVGMPATVFISPDGRILKRRTGELSRAELERIIHESFGVTVRGP